MNLNEVSPPGWGHTKAEKEKTKPWKPKSKIGGTAAAFKRALDDGRFKGLPGSTTKKEKTADMFKLMWSMKKKGDKPHYKPGTDKKYKKYQDESFEIDTSAHKKAQKKAKLRNLAKGNTNPNEKAAAEKKAGGPKLYGESISTKDTKKLNKASALDQSKDPKDWDSARARRTEIDYKDLMRQIKAKKKMRKESVENGKVDLTLKAGVNNVLKQDNKEYDRGLLAQVNKDGSYDVAYWYDKYKAYPVEVEIDGKTCAKDAKKIHIKFHPELKKEEASYKQRDKELKKAKKAMDFRHRTIHKGGDDDVNEATTMRDNNLFGNAYAGSYETLKKKIGSKKKHNKPAVEEGSLHKWFKGSKSKDGKKGWVNVVTGGTCASDEPGEGTPKCVSSSKRASMTKAERLSASRRKKKADPNQQQKSGAAKPTYVRTDAKKKMNEKCWDGYTQKGMKKKGKKVVPNCVKEEDKKGKGSGTKDACYHKVKASAKVWPSAYASGRLVQCRKKGAANYGKSKNEGFENWASDPILEKVAAWQRKEGKNKEGGLNEKGRKSYERENPGSDLKAPQPEGGSRKKSFCARMGGMKKKLTSAKTANDPDSRINKALRKWKC